MLKKSDVNIAKVTDTNLRSVSLVHGPKAWLQNKPGDQEQETVTLRGHQY